ncbi:MAG TPA: hypothetical protein PLJ78_04290 [Anaerolineae bacterium]|nr:hypothetical protein [Anaerolineae bacterium]HQK13151.1 hypothetical protein [Anaerolineae bacterium]
MTRNPRKLLPFILLLSVLLRVAVAFYYGDVVDAPPLLTDQRSYSALGARLITGKGFSFERFWYPFTPPNTPTAHWSFLYSLFIAAVYAVFGVHPLAARLTQAILGGFLLPWMVYRLTATLFGEVEMASGESQVANRDSPFALLAAAIAAVYGYFILYAATMMTETFYIVALLWSLEVGLRVGRELRRGAAIPFSLALQLGASLGIAALIRQSILPWVPVFFLWLVWQGVSTLTRWHVETFKRFSGLILAGLTLLAFILPWTYRNYRVYGEFLLLNSNTGYAMYSAQHPMHGTHFQEFAAAPLPEGLSGNEAQMDRALLRQGLRFVLDDPGRYLLLSLSRIRAFFEFWPTPDTTLLHNIGRTGSFGLFLPFMLYGLYLAVSRQPSAVSTPYSLLPTPYSLLLLFMAFYTLLHILTWAMVRYRLPVDAVALPFAALAIYDLYQRLRKRFLTLKRRSV